LSHEERAIPSALDDLVKRLSQDPSHGVQSYVSELSSKETSMTIDQSPMSSGSFSSLHSNRQFKTQASPVSTFSRPPRTTPQISAPQQIGLGTPSPSIGRISATSSELGYFDRGAGSRDDHANGQFQLHPLGLGENGGTAPLASSGGPVLNTQRTSYFPSSEARAAATASANAGDRVTVPV